MEYSQVSPAIFLRRPNRFIAHCLLDGREVVAHVKNTGRCRELLLPGVTVYLEHSDTPGRKTAYSLIGVQKGERLINMDSQAPNKVVGEALAQGTLPLDSLSGRQVTKIRPEYRMGESRLDFLVETEAYPVYLEVKGVTLEEDGVVLFPDAPTQRGIKHLEELSRLAQQGEHTALVLVVQMENVRYFTPNRKTHPQFGEALEAAAQAGVELCCCDCLVTPDSMVLHQPVPICL